MSKRKREEEPVELSIEDRDLQLKVSRLRAKIGQGVKALHNALKLARGFERQKLGRRQKNASSEPHTLLRLREEVIVLKQLQLEKTARSRLLKNLARTKRVSQHPAFVNIYGSDPTLAPVKPGAEANVVGRLFNSTPVKQALSEIMKSIYHVLGIHQAATVDSRGTDKPVDEATEQKTTPTLENDFEGFSSDGIADQADPRKGQFLDSESEDEEMFEYARGRLASSEEDSDDDDFEIPPLSTHIRRIQNNGGSRRDNLSVSQSASGISESGNEKQSGSPPSRHNADRTAFLPSLSMGGYYSGSESEGEVDQYHGPALPKPRKNRRGQRARQQLAELKHGKNAKHLGRESQGNRGSGWDIKRGAVGDSHNSNDRARESSSGRRPREDLSSTRLKRKPIPDQLKSRDDDGPIHPSWEAAKKRKMQGQTQASFQGQKITFD